jgi:hypothetical protein
LAYYNPAMLNDDTSVKLSNIALMAAVSFVVVTVIVGWMKKRSTTDYNEVYADDAGPVKDHPF